MQLSLPSLTSTSGAALPGWGMEFPPSSSVLAGVSGRPKVDRIFGQRSSRDDLKLQLHSSCLRPYFFLFSSFCTLFYNDVADSKRTSRRTAKRASFQAVSKQQQQSQGGQMPFGAIW